MSNTEHPSGGSKCPSCQAVLHLNAKFCHECGAFAGNPPDAKRLNWKRVASFIVLSAAVGVGAVLSLGHFTAEQKNITNPPLSDPVGSSQRPGQSVDLSTMSPREAADRLFNRAMAADESGDTAQAMQFAPMALQAYRLLDRPDADAHYHMGLISLVLGDPDEVGKQIENLKQDSADHLLGLVLAFKLAKRAGDEKRASDLLARFAAAHGAEIGRGKPEYEAHRITIGKLHDSARDLMTAVTLNQKPERPESGASLFASKCAGCHGPTGLGSDNGPALIHRIYEPGHHADDSFYRAVRQGVKSHHWSFGDMMPVPGVTDEQIGQIIAYVRSRQVESGIR